jgi:predicted NUDIX family phosphoesterase
MPKLALCINRGDAPNAVIDAFNQNYPSMVPIDPAFYNTSAQLVDRAICDDTSDIGRETAELTLQLLPYITLIDENDRIFTYTRGGSGDEARLHGNYSIGIGGHVDEAPIVMSLLSLLQHEAAREAHEEAGITIRPEDIELTHFIIDPTNSVGRVHLGMACTIRIKGDEVLKLEEGVIESGRFHMLDKLMDEDMYGRMENWSNLVIENIATAAGRYDQ